MNEKEALELKGRLIEHLSKIQKDMLYEKFPAFFKWFFLTYKDEPVAGAAYIIACCRDGEKDSVAWDILHATGDKAYSRETFLKASQIAIELGASKVMPKDQENLK